jgi:hypothetical protein
LDARTTAGAESKRGLEVSRCTHVYNSPTLPAAVVEEIYKDVLEKTEESVTFYVRQRI